MMAKVTGAEPLRALRAEADRISGIADCLRHAVETMTEPIAAEAGVEAARAAAEQRTAAEADLRRAEAEAAAEEMAAQMDVAGERGRAEADQLVSAAARN
jgi:hypothetical protein